MLKPHDYIKCFENSFWEWDIDELYLSVRKGITFAHWEDVKEFVSSIAPIGLPPFEVLLALMAATMRNESGTTNATIKKHLLPNVAESQLPHMLRILDTISQVSDEYRLGPNRLLLVSVIAEKSKIKVLEAVSITIAEELLSSDTRYFGSSGEKAHNHIRKVVSCLNSLDLHFPDPQTIVEEMLGFDRSKINLEHLIPGKDPLDENKNETLLEQLQNDTATEKMAALIPYVMSGMNFPIHSLHSDQRPDGGVSDLSNKGHFDQLIVSEFAYDDDYFMSRIVNNEALFYQREKAKNDNEDDLCVLVDASLYMWGLPKLIATAIACTVGMKEDCTTLDCYHVGDTLMHSDFSRFSGILKGIRFAQASISPASGIEQFSVLEKHYSNTLFVTTETSWKRPEMLPIREISNQLFDFVIFTNENAEIRVVKSKGKVAANFKLDLETIRELKQKNVQRSNTTPSASFPILFPIFSGAIKYFFHYNDEIFFIDRARGVFQFKINEEQQWNTKGARFLTRIDSDLDILGDIGRNRLGEYELLMFSRKKRQIFIYNLNQKTSKSYPFIQWRSRMGSIFYHQDNTFYFTSSEGNVVIDENLSPASEFLPYQQELHTAAISRYKSIKKSLFFGQNYIRKVREVYVTDQMELVIHLKRVELNSGRLGYWNPPIGKRKFLPTYTTPNGYRAFSFPSGESVMVNPSGIVEFQFGEKNRPTGYELRLAKVGGGKLGTVKLIHEITENGLKDAKTLVDSGSGNILYSGDRNRLNKYAHDLRQLGNNVEVTPLSLGTKFYMNLASEVQIALASQTFYTGNPIYKDDALESRQREITPAEFYDLYLKAFIENIVHGA